MIVVKVKIFQIGEAAKDAGGQGSQSVSGKIQIFKIVEIEKDTGKQCG